MTRYDNNDSLTIVFKFTYIQYPLVYLNFIITIGLIRKMLFCHILCRSNQKSAVRTSVYNVNTWPLRPAETSNNSAHKIVTVVFTSVALKNN